MKRKVGFEYLRILSMLFIIGNHFWLFMGILDKTEPFTLNFYVVWLLQAIGSLGTNCYVLISGYFGVESTVGWKKVGRLYGAVLFYSITLYFIAANIGGVFSLGELAKSLLPFSTRRYWFITDYIGLYILSPFINALCKNLDKKQFQKFILVGLLLFSILDILPGEGLNGQKGYSLYWLICVYSIGAYIRLHGLNISRKQCCINGILSIVFIYLSKIVITFLAEKVSLSFMPYSTIFYTHSSIFVLGGAVFLFMLLKDIRNTDGIIEKIVLEVSPLTFGVYLIHMNPSLAAVLWGKLKQVIDINSTTVVFWFVVTTILIYISCTVIDGIRHFFVCQINNRLKLRKNNV